VDSDIVKLVARQLYAMWWWWNSVI